MLGAAYVERIHDVLVAKLWPGTDPIADGEFRSTELLESAVARPFHSAFGEDAYPTIFEKAVALFHSLNANHPFWNGNKRTAVLALDHFLMGNDFFLVIENQEMYALAQKTASYKERGLSHDDSMAEIAEAIKEGMIPFDVILSAKAKHPKFEEYHAALLEMGDAIRKDAFNKLIESSQKTP